MLFAKRADLCVRAGEVVLLVEMGRVCANVRSCADVQMKAVAVLESWLPFWHSASNTELVLGVMLYPVP